MRSSYVVCLSNRGYRASLEPRKIYRTLNDAAAAQHGMLRIIDESGEDYLYPKDRFAVINLPPAVRRALLSST